MELLPCESATKVEYAQYLLANSYSIVYTSSDAIITKSALSKSLGFFKMCADFNNIQIFECQNGHSDDCEMYSAAVVDHGITELRTVLEETEVVTVVDHHLSAVTIATRSVILLVTVQPRARTEL